MKIEMDEETLKVSHFEAETHIQGKQRLCHHPG